MIKKVKKSRERALKATRESEKIAGFPSTLIGFYWNIVIKKYFWLVLAFVVPFMLMRIGYNAMHPFYEKWFIALFEQSVPIGTSFVMFALPTIALIVGIILLCDILEIIASWVSGHLDPRIQNHISQTLYTYVNKQSMSYFTSRYAGKMATQINYVSGGFILRDILVLVASLTVLIVGTSFTLALDWRISVMMIGALILRLIYGIWRMFPMNKSAKDASEASSTLSGKLIDSVSNFSIVKIFAGAGKEEVHITPHREKHVKTREYQRLMQRLFWAIPGVGYTFLFGGIMYICASMYATGEILVSEIVFALAIFWSVSNQISRLVDSIPNLTDVIGSAQQAYHELIKPIDINDAPNAVPLRVVRGAIDIKNLSFNYGKRKVLENFSLSIKPGEKVGLVGVSGAGKTTLVNLLMRLYDPKRGGIFIDGQNIADVTQDSLRENIAFIPQEPTMFNRTLAENIGYGRTNATLKEVKAAAKLANADAFIMTAPKKYESMVGDRGIKLSGGQRQRIAIARAFLKDAPILILDEATSALDSETENAIQESFAKLSNGRTTIAIAHRLSTLRNMDRIVVMDKGKIIESGAHSQLLRKKGVYAKLWKMQSGGFLNDEK